MPGFLPFDVKRLSEIGAAGAQHQTVRRAGVLDFVHGVAAFREKHFTLPAQRQLQQNATARQLQLAVGVGWEVWSDFEALALRPFGWREVWIGYDPAKATQNGDSAGCVVIAPPAVPGGKFRILERHQWRGMDFRAQAESIKKLTQQYNVTYIGIDSTGVGLGVYENVKMFFPAVKEFVYNPNVKNALVLKAYDIISGGRLEFDAGHLDIAQSFMAIRRATTASGNRPTYEASRSEEASHADLAWATMHALANEPLQGESANSRNIMEIF